MLKLVRYAKAYHNRLLSLSRIRLDDDDSRGSYYYSVDSRPHKEHDPEYDTPKGEFNGEFQGYGNVDRLDEMFYPEWRT